MAVLGKKHVPVLAALTSVAMTLGLWTAQFGWTERLSNVITDTYYGLGARPLAPQVVLVAIDHASIKALGRWPWDRSVLARGLAKLKAAKVVAFDLLFSETSTRHADAALARAIGQTNAVGGFFLVGSSTAQLSAASRAHLFDSSITDIRGSRLPFLERHQIDMSVEPIDSAFIFSGALNTDDDADQLFRHYPLAFVVDGTLVPSMGLQALRLFLNQDIAVDGDAAEPVRLGTTPLPMNGRGFARLRYDPGMDYQIVSFVDLVKGRSPIDLRDKLALVGITEAGVGDMRSTPVGQLPGVLLHYTFISNVLTDSLLQRPRWLEAVLILLAGGLPLIALAVRDGFKVRLALYAGAAGAIFGGGLLAYAWGSLFLEALYPLAALGFAALVTEGGLFVASERETRFLRGAFSSYVSPQLLEEVARNPGSLQLGGELREVSILFSDVRNFTTVSEQTDPRELVATLNALFTPLTAAILDNQGMLDKYIGDAIMAVFNAPLTITEHPYRACKAALEMMARLESFNRSQAERGRPGLDIGIGINSGEALVGNLGSEFRFNYTAIGDSVNLASRLEGLNKNYGSHIIIGQATYEAVRQRLLCRYLGAVTVKGKSSAEHIYELMADTPDNRERARLFERLWVAREQGQHEVVEALLQEGVERLADPVAERLLQQWQPRSAERAQA